MIKGVILDVDGVIIGNKKGYNWPDPHPQIIQAFKNLKKRGVPISLCTGKGTFAINNIVKLAHLDNLHIGDGGAILIDVLNNKIIEKHILSKELAVDIITLLKKQNAYIEIYTTRGYYVEKNQVSDITKKHTDILYQPPILVDSLFNIVNSQDIVKIMPVPIDEKEKLNLIRLLKPYSDQVSFQWGVHPTALPAQFGIITIKGISKEQAALRISKSTSIPLTDYLGVGDGLTDWGFIKLCGYKGAMGNSSKELKDIISKSSNYFIGNDVNHNGLLTIFKHFQLV